MYCGSDIFSSFIEDEETMQPKLFYSKFPQDIAKRYVLLLDPMLGMLRDFTLFLYD